jgi:pimeloyl-ACP methyl ester carboxylesterase
VHIVERGQGVPMIVVPGLQGRWEWMAPAIDALAAYGRVLTYSLADERTSGCRCETSLGFDAYLAQLDELYAQVGLDQAVLVGVSYGGLIAAEYAARRPERLLGLVLASALPPGWEPDARARFYLRAPRLLSPVFVLGSPLRMYPELRAATGSLAALARTAVAQGLRVLRAPMSPTRMARRLAWCSAHRFSPRLPHDVPALVVTGEPGLDRVVPPGTTARYLELLPQARLETLPRTGHIGLVTRPPAFASLVGGFARACGTRAANPVRKVV